MGGCETWIALFDCLSSLHCSYPLTREQACEEIVSSLHPNDVVVSTTGMLSRELFEFRARHQQGHHRDFLTVGSMGHASSIAMGICIGKQDRQVWRMSDY